MLSHYLSLKYFWPFSMHTTVILQIQLNNIIGSTDTCINKSCGIEKVYQYHVYFFWKKSCIPVLQPFCCWRISAIQNIIKKSSSHTVSELHNIVHAFKIQWSTMHELRVVKNYSSSHLQCCQGSRITLHLNRFPHRLHKKKKKKRLVVGGPG